MDLEVRRFDLALERGANRPIAGRTILYSAHPCDVTSEGVSVSRGQTTNEATLAQNALAGHVPAADDKDGTVIMVASSGVGHPWARGRDLCLCRTQLPHQGAGTREAFAGYMRHQARPSGPRGGGRSGGLSRWLLRALLCRWASCHLPLGCAFHEALWRAEPAAVRSVSRHFLPH